MKGGNKAWKIKHDLRQGLLKARYWKKKKEERKKNQGVPKKEIGLKHLMKFSPYQYSDYLNDLKDNFKSYTHVPAPKVFSMVDNSEECISFINKIQDCYKKKEKVFVNLEQVERLSDDAIVILLSNMIRFKESHIRFNGNYPKDNISSVKLKKSGFFSYLYGSKRKSGYSINTMNRTIYTHGNVKADAAFSSEIIEASSKFVWGESRRCPGIQNTFTELMANTYKHASDKEGGHHWWMSMTKDETERKVVYGFVDYGVGIFRSLENKKPNDKLYGALQIFKSKFPLLKSNEQIMEKILKGELHKTVTRQTNRGKGLPSIYTNLTRNEIDSLVIITNNVYADVKNNDYRLLKNEFFGTFVKWEMNTSVISIKNNYE